jgi:hypothetical protein
MVTFPAAGGWVGAAAGGCVGAGAAVVAGEQAVITKARTISAEKIVQLVFLNIFHSFQYSSRPISIPMKFVLINWILILSISPPFLGCHSIEQQDYVLN